ncbi:hypothetical protein [Psychroserpens sp.]|uniref:hypothetical protein n=1 Tax=Psychroserpens sp. TaxID=2020870 RepID=UPI003003A203
MKINKNFLAFLSLIFPLMLSAQVESIFNDIRLNQSLQVVTQKLSKISESSNIISIEKPSFPLANNQEEHLVCSQVKTDNGIISSVVFTFADDKLKYIEARGNARKTLTRTLTDTTRTYLDYDVYVSEKLFLKKKEDAAWILTQEGMHTGLFAWENPYIDAGYKNKIKSKSSSQIPEFIKMGVSLDELMPSLESNSNFTNTEKLDGTDPNAQIQINCFGVDYLGFPRKIEARFGNNILNAVWILTGKGEEDRIRKALTNQYGKPIFVNDDWEIFNNWQVGLRKDKPEILLLEKEIGLKYKTSYFKQ